MRKAILVAMLLVAASVAEAGQWRWRCALPDGHKGPCKSLYYESNEAKTGCALGDMVMALKLAAGIRVGKAEFDEPDLVWTSGSISPILTISPESEDAKIARLTQELAAAKAAAEHRKERDARRQARDKFIRRVLGECGGLQ